MKKLLMLVLASSMSVAVAGAYAQDTMKKDEMKKEGMKKDEMKKDSMSKDTMK